MNKEEIEKYKEIIKEKINKIVEDYDRNELTNKEIIEKYNLIIRPDELRHILPPKRTEEICPFCSEKMTHERLRKREEDFDLICPSCNHVKYRAWKSYLKCQCDNCMKEEEERKNKIKKKIQEHIKDKKKINLEEVSLEDLANLYFLFCINYGHDLSKIKTKSIILEEGAIGLIRTLKDKNMLVVSPDSDVDAFSIVDDELHYLDTKVDWMVNIEMDEEVKKIFNDGRFPIQFYDRKVKKYYFNKMIKEFLIKDVEQKMQERGRRFAPTIESLVRYRIAVQDISYTQAEYMNYKTVVWAVDYYNVKGYNKQILEKTILNFICDTIERYKENNWEIYKSNPNYINDRLRLIIENVLCEETIILNEPINSVFDDCYE